MLSGRSSIVGDFQAVDAPILIQRQVRDGGRGGELWGVGTRCRGMGLNLGEW